MQKFIRHGGLWLLPTLVMAWLFWTDPDLGGSTRDMLKDFSVGVFAVTMAYAVRKWIAPYIKLEDFVREAKKSPTGAGMVVLATMIFMSAVLIVFASRAHAQDVRTYVPTGAYTYAPTLKAEQVRLWPDHTQPAMLGALVEQESCITLKHARCWNPGARLKTAREEGAGFGQITRAYRDDGSLRFDALDSARSLDPSLSQWSWANVYQRPDLQLRAIVVMNRDCHRHIARLVSDPIEQLRFCDAAYNGGYPGMQQERRACGQRTECNPQRWYANVEKTCLKSKTKWKGYGASACEINRSHVDMVTRVRWPKYKPLLEAS